MANRHKTAPSVEVGLSEAHPKRRDLQEAEEQRIVEWSDQRGW